MLHYRIYRHTSCIVLTRYTSTTSESKSIQPPNPKKISTDMIGPPDPVSNLRKIIFKQSVNETELEKKYREMRAEVQDWNQNFWTQHNSRFFQVCNSQSFTQDLACQSSAELYVINNHSLSFVWF